MKIISMSVGLLGSNCYLVYDETMDNAAAIIDPGGDSDLILEQVKKYILDVIMILLTHGHFDHVMGVPGVLEAIPGIPVYITEIDYPEARDGGEFGYRMGEVPGVVYYDEGDTVQVGSMVFEVLCTPGHTRGSITLKTDGVLFTGDCLFAGSCGRTDFPGGSFKVIRESLKRLGELPGDYHVLPGHEGTTMLEYERRNNPFMRHS